MKVLTSKKEIREALAKVRPSAIAVAYVGLDWDSFISVSNLREVIVSPTLGSNPKAIEELMQELGAENVHFLDELHSKIYLGASEALLGSCNLSANGISEQGLYETAVVLVDKDARRQLARQIHQYKGLARQRYPTPEAKLARLQRLKVDRDRAVCSGFVPAGHKSPSIQSYGSRLDRIHVCWHGSGEMGYNESKVRRALKISSDLDLDDYFSDDFAFHKNDDVRPGDWILGWRCNDDGMPRKRGDVGWMYVHRVIPDGFDDDSYPKLAGQVKSKFLPAEPFTLDQPTKALIRDTLGSGQFPALLSRDDSAWRLAPADAVTPAFIEALKEASHARG